jgi:hypothetical protein
MNLNTGQHKWPNPTTKKNVGLNKNYREMDIHKYKRVNGPKSLCINKTKELKVNMRQTMTGLEREIDKTTITLRESTTHHSIVDKATTQKISKNSAYTTNNEALVDIYSCPLTQNTHHSQEPTEHKQ